MKAQYVALADGDEMKGSMNQEILELDPNHVLVKDLKWIIEQDELERKSFTMLLCYAVGMTSGYDVEKIFLTFW